MDGIPKTMMPSAICMLTLNKNVAIHCEFCYISNFHANGVNSLVVIVAYKICCELLSD